VPRVGQSCPAGAKAPRVGGARPIPQGGRHSRKRHRLPALHQGPYPTVIAPDEHSAPWRSRRRARHHPSPAPFVAEGHTRRAWMRVQTSSDPPIHTQTSLHNHSKRPLPRSHGRCPHAGTCTTLAARTTRQTCFWVAPRCSSAAVRARHGLPGVRPLPLRPGGQSSNAVRATTAPVIRVELLPA
jgi:hypothetical protein